MLILNRAHPRSERESYRLVGIDVSKASLDVYLAPTGETRQFPNSTTDFRRLVTWLGDHPVSRGVYERTLATMGQNA